MHITYLPYQASKWAPKLGIKSASHRIIDRLPINQSGVPPRPDPQSVRTQTGRDLQSRLASPEISVDDFLLRSARSTPCLCWVTLVSRESGRSGHLRSLRVPLHMSGRVRDTAPLVSRSSDLSPHPFICKGGLVPDKRNWPDGCLRSLLLLITLSVPRC